MGTRGNRDLIAVHRLRGVFHTPAISIVCIISAGLILLGCAPSLGSLLQPGLAGESLAGFSQLSLAAAQGPGSTLQAPASPGEVGPASIDCPIRQPPPAPYADQDADQDGHADTHRHPKTGRSPHLYADHL